MNFVFFKPTILTVGMIIFSCCQTEPKDDFISIEAQRYYTDTVKYVDPETYFQMEATEKVSEIYDLAKETYRDTIEDGRIERVFGEFQGKLYQIAEFKDENISPYR